MIKFLLKGLFRDRSRSLFPALTVSMGALLTVFFYSFMQGFIYDYVRTSAQFDTGHVKITTRAYKEQQDQIPNDLALLGVDAMLEKLRSSSDGMLWTPRIRFGGLLDIPDAKGETRSQGPVMGMGLDLRSPGSPEPEIMGLEKAIVEGRMPQRENEILISREFARKLGVKPGDTATLLGSTMHGSMSVYNFKVSGIVFFGMNALDRSTIIADINDVRAALDMADGAGEIFGFSRDLLYHERKMAILAEKYNAQYSKKDDEFSPLMTALSGQAGLAEMMGIMKSFGAIIVGIFMLAMSIVLWNSGLLNGLRRYGEIGVRLAMGEPKTAIYFRTIIESVIVGIAGSLLGTALGLAVSYYLQIVGVDVGAMMQKSTMMLPNIMRAQVTAACFYIGFIPGVFASVLGTMFAGIGIYRRQTSQLFKELEV